MLFVQKSKSLSITDLVWFDFSFGSDFIILVLTIKMKALDTIPIKICRISSKDLVRIGSLSQEITFVGDIAPSLPLMGRFF